MVVAGRGTRRLFFSWGSRGGRSLHSPAVTGGWGEPALLLPVSVTGSPVGFWGEKGIGN